MLGEHVDEADLASLLSEATDHVAVGVAPPRDCEGNVIPLGVWLGRGQVQVAALGAVNLSSLGNGINIGTGLKRSLFENLLHESKAQTSE